MTGRQRVPLPAGVDGGQVARLDQRHAGARYHGPRLVAAAAGMLDNGYDRRDVGVARQFVLDHVVDATDAMSLCSCGCSADRAASLFQLVAELAFQVAVMGVSDAVR